MLIIIIVLVFFASLYLFQRPLTLLLHRLTDIRSISKAIAAKDVIIGITQSSRVESIRQALNWRSLIDHDSGKVFDAYGRIALPCHLINPDLDNISHRVTLLKISLDKYYEDLANYMGNDDVRSIELLAKVNHSICRVRIEVNAICRTLEQKRNNIKAIKIHM
tara:strand:+ start:3324 stop:3812 length:489 start_codon:yes stop_codon:yes gene_type:complete